MTNPATHPISAFTVLLERRAIPQRLVAALLCVLLVVGSLLAVRPAFGQIAQSKIAPDLQSVISVSQTPSDLNWAKDVNGVRYVKALVISNGTDPDMVALRSAIVSAGGSVYFRFVSVSAATVLLPAKQVANIAARSDVLSISPDRLVGRTASSLEYVTGTLTSAVRSYSTTTTYSGLDGTGIGIAVLDSGIGWSHLNMMAPDGKTTRVKKAVDLTKAGDATLTGTKDWTPGIDASASLYPGSATMSTYETNINAMGTDRSDPYGHGRPRSRDSCGAAPFAAAAKRIQ